MASEQNHNQGSRPRGFASMDPKRQREIASQGGRAAHEQGVAHEFSPDEAREAGRKGGEAVSQDREHMAEIGRKGGEASGGGRGRSGNGGASPSSPASAAAVLSSSQPSQQVMRRTPIPPKTQRINKTKTADELDADLDESADASAQVETDQERAPD